MSNLLSKYKDLKPLPQDPDMPMSHVPLARKMVPSGPLSNLAGVMAKYSVQPFPKLKSSNIVSANDKELERVEILHGPNCGS